MLQAQRNLEILKATYRSRLRRARQLTYAKGRREAIAKAQREYQEEHRRLTAELQDIETIATLK